VSTTLRAFAPYALSLRATLPVRDAIANSFRISIQFHSAQSQLTPMLVYQNTNIKRTDYTN
jgi:hypothetical protein